MLCLLRRACGTTSRPTTRTILRVEDLEWRDQPSDLVSTGGDGNYAPVNQPPQIVNFSAQLVGSGAFLLTGRVIDENPGGLTITFDGVVSTTVTTQSDGSFSIIVNVSFSGFITASTVDDHNQASNVPDVFVSP
jgi:hypothetical protein